MSKSSFVCGTILVEDENNSNNQKSYESMPAVFGNSFGDHPFLCDQDGLIVEEESVYGRQRKKTRKLTTTTATTDSSFPPKNIVTPTDGIPVALLIHRGSCSFEEKARTAQSISDHGVIKFVIVMDDSTNSNGRLVPMSATDPVGIDLSLLFVSKSTGQDLLDLWKKNYGESDDDGKYYGDPEDDHDHDSSAGPLLLIDATSPIYPNAPYYKDAQQWILAAMAGFFTFLACFGCLLVCFQAGYLPVETAQWLDRVTTISNNNNHNNNNMNGGRYPSLSKALLTPEQVRQLPSGRQQQQDYYHDEATTSSSCLRTFRQQQRPQQQQLCCAICLEEYRNDGVMEEEDVRRLPSCGHLYHTECLVPWLTERSANCPLCKAEVVPVRRSTTGSAGEQRRPLRSRSSVSASSSSSSSHTWWRGSYGSTTTTATSFPSVVFPSTFSWTTTTGTSTTASRQQQRAASDHFPLIQRGSDDADNAEDDDQANTQQRTYGSTININNDSDEEEEQSSSSRSTES